MLSSSTSSKPITCKVNSWREHGISGNNHSFRRLSIELQQTALSGLLRHLFAALQEIRIRDRLVINVGDYTIYCADADENKVGGCTVAVRNDYKNLVELNVKMHLCTSAESQRMQTLDCKCSLTCEYR
ncbi:hypothetical protein RB195_000900 [Necator americanus]|uniref:Uncharacterized protein n=1 Tax=Necator americanus TaxID=51031 RepID=A0ABR1DCH8_NECAM